MVDFIPDIHVEDVKRILFKHKDQHAVLIFPCAFLYDFVNDFVPSSRNLNFSMLSLLLIASVLVNAFNNMDIAHCFFVIISLSEYNVNGDFLLQIQTFRKFSFIFYITVY